MSSSSHNIASVDLVRQAQGGSREAFNTLFIRYSERVRKVVRMRLPEALRRTCDSIDIVQQTFVVAVKGFERFEIKNESSFINWLAKIAENEVRTRMRKANVHYERELDPMRQAVSSSNGPFEPADPADLPIDVAQRHEEERILEECMAELPQHYREVLLWRHFMTPPGKQRSVSWEIVAAELGCGSSDAARSLHARAKSALATLIMRHMHE